MYHALQTSLSIAPMIDWTYDHFRVLMRILAPKALLYTEMQTTGSILHQTERALAFNRAIEHPLALQLGGSSPEELSACANLANPYGYSEYNLNLGCPSSRVQAGLFGACLMKSPKLVGDCIRALKDATTVPISAKTRIGIDTEDSYAFFADFVGELMEAGCDKLVVHARKAWLKGLNPKQNRTIPPVHYPFVYNIKKEYPHIPVIINGNIISHQEIKTHLEQVDGVMLGRLACQNPYAIAIIHHQLYNTSLPTRTEVLRAYFDYAASLIRLPRKSLLIKPILNLAAGLAHAKQYKEALLTHPFDTDKILHTLQSLEAKEINLLDYETSSAY